MNVDLTKPKVPTQALKWLGTYGKYLWPKLTAYLNKSNKIIRADEYLIQQYCSAYDIYRQAYEDLQKNGIQQKVYKTSLSPVDGSVVSRDFQGFKKNPAYNMMSDSLGRLNTIGKQLGLSPQARNKLMELSGPDTEKKSVAESMKEFFKS